MSEKEVPELGRQEIEEIARRRAPYRRAAALSPTARTAIPVDDGVAPGATIKAAIAAIRQRKPRKIVVAVPVMSRQSALEIRGDVDAIVCIAAPRDFRAVGEFYRDFRLLSDEDASASLAEFARGA